MYYKIALYSACLTVALLTCPVHAAEEQTEDVKALLKAIKEQAARLDAQEKRLAAQQKSLAQQQKDLVDAKKNFNALVAKASYLTGEKIASVSETIEAAGDAVAKKVATLAPSAGEEPPPDYLYNEKPKEVGVEKKQASEEKPPEIAAVLDEGGVLLQEGKFVVTPAIEYGRSSATRVAISGFSIIPALNIGSFEITQVGRDTVTPSVSMRYGVTNRFEIEGKVPYVYRSDTTKTRPVGTGSSAETLSKVTGLDIGDIEFGGHYQINDGQEGWPFFIGNMRVKTTTGTSPFDVMVVNGVEQELPTGTGFWAFQPSVTAIYPSDPVVFYSNLGYLYNVSDSFPGVGTIDPGDSVGASFGTSLALNDRASVSLGYSHNTVFRSRQNGQTIANSAMLQVGSLDLGYSYALSDRTNLNFSISAGVTDDAPDVRLIFRTPIVLDMDDFSSVAR